MIWFTLWHTILFVPLILLQLGFLILKMNRNIDWVWSLVLLWTWIMLLLLLIHHIKYLVLLEEYPNETKQVVRLRRTRAIFNVINTVLVITFAVLAAVQLDTHFSDEWAYVFIPLWILLVAELIVTPVFDVLYRSLTAGSGDKPTKSFGIDNQTYPLAAVDRDEDPDALDSVYDGIGSEGGLYVSIPACQNVNWYLLKWELLYLAAAAFAILLVTVENSSDASWPLKFIPVWFAILVWTISLCSDLYYKLAQPTNMKTYRLTVYLCFEVLLWIGTAVFTPLLMVYLMHVHHPHGHDWDEDHDWGSLMDPTTIFSPLILAFFIIFFASFFLYYIRREDEKRTAALGKPVKSRFPSLGVVGQSSSSSSYSRPTISGFPSTTNFNNNTNKPRPEKFF